MPEKNKILEALFFDLDGLICDTETPDFKAWEYIFGKYGHTLPIEKYAECVGSGVGFDPGSYLLELAGPSESYDQLWQEHERLHWDMLPDQALPGVVELINEALQCGIELRVVSSSSNSWVSRIIERVKLSDMLTNIICRENVSQVKPFPDLYIAACKSVELEPSKVIAIEDSPNGANAALNAGLRCIVVPNTITRGLFFPQHADIFHFKTLEDITVRKIEENLELSIQSKKRSGMDK